MKLVGRVPVEPLDDERWTNIERRVVAGAADAAAHRAPSRSLGRFALATGAIAAVVVVAGMVGWKLHHAPGPAQVAESPLRVDSTAGHASTIDIGDARITSGPSTKYEVTRPGGGVLVSMTRGKVGLEVGKRGHRPPLVVRAGDTDVVVVGTRFTVDYGDGSGPVDVRVTEGVVRVVHQHHEDRVAAGEAWRTDEGKLTSTQLAAFERARNRIADAGSSAAGRVDVPTTGPDIELHDRVAKVPDTKVATRPPAIERHPAVHRPDYVRPTPHREGSGDARHDLRSDILAQPLPPVLDVGAPDATRAISKLREIVVTRRGTEASHALYSIAVLQHRKLGRNGDALSTLDLFRRRFTPTDGDYKAALWLRVRILCLRRIDDECRRAAVTYAHEDPGTPAGHVAGLLAITPD